MPKILVFIPYHEAKRYSLDNLFNWIQSADLKDCEIVLRVHKGPYGEYNELKRQREFARVLAINNNFTHLFSIGVDTIPPLDVIPKLLVHNTDVVGGVYMSRKNEPTAIAWRDSVSPREFPKLFDGSLITVDGMGMDCVLFTRKALNSFSYYDWKVNDDDYPAYNLLKEKGFKIYLDTSVVCKHYSSPTTFG